MGFFSFSRKIISQQEFKDLLSLLYAKGFQQREIKEVEKIFRGDLYESSDYERGIDATEIKHALSWMRKNPKHHDISKQKVDLLEELLKAKL